MDFSSDRPTVAVRGVAALVEPATAQWHMEPVTASLLRHHAVGYMTRQPMGRERLRRYEACWDAAAERDSHAPLPCPECYSKGMISPMRLTVGPANCAKCGTTLAFRDR